MMNVDVMSSESRRIYIVSFEYFAWDIVLRMEEGECEISVHQLKKVYM